MYKPIYQELHQTPLESLYKLFFDTFKSHPNKEKIFEALKVAEKYHNGQKRKDGKPYITHLLRIAITMKKSFRITNSELIIAAIFHDLLEDTKITSQEIINNWGDNVYNLVHALTHEKILHKTPLKKYNLRRNKYKIYNGSSREIQLLAFFDNLDNSSDWKYLNEDNKHFKKIPRWMAQMESFYIPLAEHIGTRYAKIMNKLHMGYVKMGFRPKFSNFDE